MRSFLTLLSRENVMFANARPHRSRALASRIRQLASRCRADNNGVAAIEFAFVVPIMFVMFVGAVELSQAVTVDRRVTQSASSVADLVARKETKITPAEIGDIMRIGGYVVAPYNQTPLQVIVRNVSSSAADATKTKTSWQCTFAATGPTASPTCTCTNDAFSLPSGLVGTNDSVVVVDANYSYTPLVFDYFLKGMTAGAGGPGTYLFTERIFMKPRGQAAVLEQQNGSPCPTPTF
jgi:Flp pilus assembly protein TadG